jgi:hypothetical protein
LTDSNNVQPDEILVQKVEKKTSLRFKKVDAADSIDKKIRALGIKILS